MNSHIVNNNLKLINTSDSEFDVQYPILLKAINNKKLYVFEPKLNEIQLITQIIINFLKEKKRKIYGGYALNKLLVNKDPSAAIYDESNFPDIDFYSPEPLKDLVYLCDTLHKEGFLNINGCEAQHKETYSIFVNFKLYCDITYMPINVYSKIRYIEIEKLNIIHPSFMMIDYFRMFTDPLISFWRLSKHFSRYKSLQSYYPLPIINQTIKIQDIEENILNILNLFFDKLCNLETIIFTGYYVYNYYLHISRYNKKNYNYINIPYIEVYSINYVSDGLDILDYIKTLPEDVQEKISHVEYYPLFQFYGYNTIFYYNNGEKQIPLLVLYSNNKKCITYKKVNLIKFNNLTKTKFELIDKKINIGNYDFNMLHALIMLVKNRIDNNEKIKNDLIYKYINGLVIFKNYYLMTLKKTEFDDTIFQSFVIDYMGENIQPERERKLLIQIRKKLNKPYIFRYEPGVSKNPGSYYFLNSSGNSIKKTNNLRLIEANLNLNLEDELLNDETHTTDNN